MSDEITIPLPKLGESIVSATVVRWFKKVGDPVALDEPLLEVSTDKINSEIPSPVAGVLQEILVLPDQECQVGDPLAIVATSQKTSRSESAQSSASPSLGGASQEDLLSPSVMRLLQERKVPLEEIGQIPRSGQGGRLTKKDVEEYCAQKECPHREKSLGTERVKMSSLRKAIAENMVRSFYEAPHASLMTEVDVTELVQFIQEQKELFFERHGAKLSITAFVVRAIARCTSDFPLINASLEGGDTIVMKRSVNLGIAVSVETKESLQGGIMVPVIRECQKLSLEKIAKEISHLATKAREHRLQPDDVQEGTLTLTNFGMTGVRIGIPIIRYPEVAILGMGAVSKQAKVMSDGSITPRSTVWLSLTFDHRVLDGLYGCGFLNAVKTFLEQDAWR